MLHLRLCFLLAFLLWLPSSASAQSEIDTLDVIRRKDGLLFRGTIAERLPDGGVVIKVGRHSHMVDGNQIHDSWREIAEPHLYLNTHRPGMYLATELGFMPGYSGNWLNIAVNTRIAVGYKFNQRLSAGVMSGFDALLDELILPVMAEGRYEVLGSSTTSPYVVLRSGIAVSPPVWQPSNVSRIVPTAEAGVGYLVALSRNTALNLSMVFNYQQHERVRTMWNGIRHETITINRMAWRIGFIF